MANRWGTSQDQPFTGTLTNNFTDNREVAILPQVTTVVLLVDYNKGSETLMEILLEYSSQFDSVPVFYQESILDLSSEQIGVFTLKIPTSGKYRIPIPVSVQEEQMRVSAKAGGGVPSGTFTFDFVEDKFVPRT